MYKHIIIDAVNFGYLNMKKEYAVPVSLGNKKVYPEFVKNYLTTLDFLMKKFLEDDGQVTLLFDNYNSREELKEALKPLKASENRKKVNPNYKSNRVANTPYFYNSLDLIRYIHQLREPKYHTARIPNLEADDLVKPCINYLGDEKILMITNDSDWCRYLDKHIQYLPDLYGEPVTREAFQDKYGYYPSEDKVILYKILNGDTVDNVQAVFPQLKPAIKSYIMDNFDSVIDFMFDAHKHDILSEFITDIKDSEIDIKVAYQMLATIPVTDEHFKAVYTTGRSADYVLKVIYEVIEYNTGKEEKPVFEFGGLDVPRYTPKG